MSPPVGEIDINLAEVRFQPLAGIVIQRDECFAFIDAVNPNESTNRVVAAKIAMLVPQPFKNPHRRMPLFGRLRFILVEDLKNSLMKRPQPGGRLSLTLRIGLRLPLAPQDFTDLSP